MTDVSLTMVEALAPATVMVSVSAASVKLSAAMGTKIVAVPPVPIVAAPLKAPPVMSAAETPDKV